MRLLIVGVGQIFNFATKQMEDILQVQTPDGSEISVPVTNEATQMLVDLALNGVSQDEDLGSPYPANTPDLSYREYPEEVEDDIPVGAAVFGGEVREEVRREITEKPRVSEMGRTKNPSDRSGVPSYGISRVDQRGNPILPAPPDITMDDEEDPGEQV